ncbi:glycosyltransferase [Neobacillus mesonae]|nr:glycosyltransferase [Neobacillus mesonae]
MNTQPLVTIVIPFYNCPYIHHSIRSALEQTYPSIEIIVVDDGSTIHANLIDPYRPYIYYLGKQNGGTATALNHGIRYASGEYIVWLSSDDMLYPEKVAMQVGMMQELGASISHTNFNYINEHGVVTQFRAGPSPMSRQEMLRFFLLGNPVNGCTVMIHKSVFTTVGLFDESLPYTHDYDLWYRVLLAGHSIPYITQPLTAYRRHQGMGTLRYEGAIAHEISMTKAKYRDRVRGLI